MKGVLSFNTIVGQIYVGFQIYVGALIASTHNDWGKPAWIIILLAISTSVLSWHLISSFSKNYVNSFDEYSFPLFVRKHFITQPVSFSMRRLYFLKASKTSDFCRNITVSVYLVLSSINVTKYFALPNDSVLIGPQMSECIKNNFSVFIWLLTNFCFIAYLTLYVRYIRT